MQERKKALQLTAYLMAKSHHDRAIKKLNRIISMYGTGEGDRLRPEYIQMLIEEEKASEIASTVFDGAKQTIERRDLDAKFGN